MDIMEQIRLMGKLSPATDEIINSYNNGIMKFEPKNKEQFEQYSKTILEMAGGAGIQAKYENGTVFIVE